MKWLLSIFSYTSKAPKLRRPVHLQSSRNKIILNRPPTRRESCKRCSDQVIFIQGDTGEAGLAFNRLHEIQRLLNSNIQFKKFQALAVSTTELGWHQQPVPAARLFQWPPSFQSWKITQWSACLLISLQYPNSNERARNLLKISSSAIFLTKTYPPQSYTRWDID